MSENFQPEPRKILVIDDDAQFHKLIALHLRKEGFEDVVGASSGQEGVRQAKQSQPGVVIIDTVLPDVDGFEICREIRAAALARDPKIIITTGSIDAVDAGKARDAGADDYIVKTADFSHLMLAVRRFYAD